MKYRSILVQLYVDYYLTLSGPNTWEYDKFVVFLNIEI
jgi:hypothetical protein